MNRKIFSRQFLFSDIAILCYLALFKLILHFLTNGNYGYFRDELYYIACSDHLAFGYVDQPPLSIFLLAINRLILGDSILALRFLPALAGAIVVIITGLIVRQLGGGRFAQSMAALATLITSAYLVLDGFYSMNAFDVLFWSLAIYIIILIIRRGEPKLWLLFGVVAGLGLLNKYSIGFFGLGFIIALLFTPHRKYFLSKWLWIAGLIAFMIFLPHIIWQIQNDYPSLEFMRNASQYKNYPVSPLEFLSGQMLLLSFINGPLCLVGLYYYFFNKEGKFYRLFGWIYLILLIVMIAIKAKIYYISPAYPMLLAPGALVTEKFIRRLNWNWLKPAFIGILLIFGIIVTPIAIPVLPVETLIKYEVFLGIVPPQTERVELEALPQHFADRFGWKEMVATVAKVYQNLSPEEQNKCVIFVRNYGEAGAIDFFGKKYNLPKAICAHNNYWLWGQDQVDKAYDVAIVFGWSRNIQENLDDLRSPDRFEHVELAATTKCRYCMPFENNRPIFLCRNPKFSFKDIWPEERFYY